MNSNHKIPNVVLFGTGYMGREYLKVLSALKCNVQVVGRIEEKAKLLAGEFGATGFGGGAGHLKNVDAKSVDLAIIATPVESLKDLTISCLEAGLKRILVEKPGAVNLSELNEIKSKNKTGTKILLGYNRRFFCSVMKLKSRLSEEGGPIGCFIDFTEREKYIIDSKLPESVRERWGIANSTHVLDTAFYLVGLPREINALRDSSWERHSSGSTFVGCGRTDSCLFSYFATWRGGGRWNIEVSTKEGRYKLCPLEELHFSRKNQFASEKIDNADDYDIKFKPGVYKMVKGVLFKDDTIPLPPDLDEHIELVKSANRIFGYED